jgi:hypothetical protein
MDGQARRIHTYPKLATALSRRGPMCSGALLALVNSPVNREHWDALTLAKRGWVGLLYPPFTAPGTTVNIATATRATCAHPDCNMPQCDPFHVLTECRHSGLTTARAAARASAMGIATTILTSLEDPRAPTSPGSSTSNGAAHPAVATFNAIPSAWDTHAGRFAAFRLLTAAPWSAEEAHWRHERDTSATRGAWLTLPLVLGTTMDDAICKTHTLRPLANAWVKRAGKACFDAAAAWRAAAPAPQPTPADVQR